MIADQTATLLADRQARSGTVANKTLDNAITASALARARSARLHRRRRRTAARIAASTAMTAAAVSSGSLQLGPGRVKTEIRNDSNRSRDRDYRHADDDRFPAPPHLRQNK